MSYVRMADYLASLGQDDDSGGDDTYTPPPLTVDYSQAAAASENNPNAQVVTGVGPNQSPASGQFFTPASEQPTTSPVPAEYTESGTSPATEQSTTSPVPAEYTEGGTSTGVGPYQSSVSSRPASTTPTPTSPLDFTNPAYMSTGTTPPSANATKDDSGSTGVLNALFSGKGGGIVGTLLTSGAGIASKFIGRPQPQQQQLRPGVSTAVGLPPSSLSSALGIPPTIGGIPTTYLAFGGGLLALGAIGLIVATSDSGGSRRRREDAYYPPPGYYPPPPPGYYPPPQPQYYAPPPQPQYAPPPQQYAPPQQPQPQPAAPQVARNRPKKKRRKKAA